MNQAPIGTPAPAYDGSRPHNDGYHGDRGHMQWQQPQQPQQYQQQQQQQQQGNIPEKGFSEPQRTAVLQAQHQTPVPIPSLGRTPAPVECPGCHTRGTTRISHHAGNTTHAWAFATCCLTGCLCFIPYLMTSMKDVDHHCGNCNRLLATWHKSGSVEVHAYA